MGFFDEPDINCDGKVDALDRYLLMQMSASSRKEAIDLTGDDTFYFGTDTYDTDEEAKTSNFTYSEPDFFNRFYVSKSEEQEMDRKWIVSLIAAKIACALWGILKALYCICDVIEEDMILCIVPLWAWIVGYIVFSNWVKANKKKFRKKYGKGWLD